jgi:hypothetical protein
MSTDYMTGTTISDFELTLAIPGDADSVKLRLLEAIQKLGYKILGEQPLYAKRGAQGSASSGCSWNVVDYPTRLTVSLKQTNNLSVLATFSYEIKSHVLMTKGDRQTLAREAEAIVALATERLAASACRACGTQITDESHFCRRCGTPLLLDVPELEILRLTRSTRGSYHNLVTGLLAFLLAVLILLPVFIAHPATNFSVLIWIGAAVGTFALFQLLQGLWQLHRTLNPKTTSRSIGNTNQPSFRSSVTTALPPAPVNASITEGTTELLVPTADRREKQPVLRKDHNTSELDTDQLM